MKLFYALCLSAIILPPAANAVPENLFERYTTLDGLPHDSVTDMLGDREGFLWLATPAGLSRFDGYDFANHPLPGHGPATSAEGARLSLDGRGYLWLATDGGELYRFDRDGELFTDFPRSLPELGGGECRVEKWLADSGGRIWLALGDRGLVRVEQAEGGPPSVAATYRDEEHVGRRVDLLREDVAGRLWVCSEAGVTVIDPAKRNVGEVTLACLAGRVSDMVETDSTMWLASQRGVVMVETRTLNPVVHELPGGDEAAALLPSPDGRRLYVGTVRSGIGTLDPATGVVSLDGRDIGRVRSMSFDSHGVMWVLTDRAGITRYRPETRDYRGFGLSPLSGLVDANAAARMVERDGVVWVDMGGMGFGRYDRQRDEITPLYGVNPPPVTCFWAGPGGVLWFSTRDGGLRKAIVAAPAEVAERDYDLRFTSLAVDNRSVVPGEGSPLKKSLPAAGEIDIPWNYSSFRVDFAALDFGRQSRVGYMYRLEGYHDEWIVSGRVRSAFFSGVPAGRYSLAVRCCDMDDPARSQEATLAVRIASSPWYSWWAWAIYAALGALSLICIYRRLVKICGGRRGAHSEKRLAELKANFFDTVSHELRSPLTMIVGGVDEVIRHETLSERGETNIRLVEQNARRMLATVNRMLEPADGTDVVARTGGERSANGDFDRRRRDGRAEKTSGLPAPDDGETMTIMVVEDNPDVRTFLHNLLCDDFRIVEADDGMHALELLRSGSNPDVMITDLMMPRMDGIELTAAIRDDFLLSHLPVIILTARSAVESRISATRYGADDYITKPFEVEHLLASIGNLLARRRRLTDKLSAEAHGDMKVVSLAPSQVLVTDRDEEFIRTVMSWIEQNIENRELTIDQLSEHMNMGRTTMYKKLKSLTGRSPVEVIKNYRVEKARMILDTGKRTVSETAYRVGFSEPGYFSKCFKDTYGLSPVEYMRNRQTQGGEN